MLEIHDYLSYIEKQDLNISLGHPQLLFPCILSEFAQFHTAHLLKMLKGQYLKPVWTLNQPGTIFYPSPTYQKMCYCVLAHYAEWAPNWSIYQIKLILETTLGYESRDQGGFSLYCPFKAIACSMIMLIMCCTPVQKQGQSQSYCYQLVVCPVPDDGPHRPPSPHPMQRYLIYCQGCHGPHIPFPSIQHSTSGGNMRKTPGALYRAGGGKRMMRGKPYPALILFNLFTRNFAF